MNINWLLNLLRTKPSPLLARSPSIPMEEIGTNPIFAQLAVKRLMNPFREYMLYPHDNKLNLIRGKNTSVRLPLPAKPENQMDWSIHNHPWFYSPYSALPSPNDLVHFKAYGHKYSDIVDTMTDKVIRLNYDKPFTSTSLDGPKDVHEIDDLLDTVFQLKNWVWPNTNYGRKDINQALNPFGVFYETMPIEQHPILGKWLRLLKK